MPSHALLKTKAFNAETKAILNKEREDMEKDDRFRKIDMKPIKDKQWQIIFDGMRIGMTLKDCADLARVGYMRLQRNIDAEVHYRRDIREMAADCKRHHLQRIYDGEKGWQSSAWWLERMYRREYCLNLPDAKDDEKAVQMRKIVRRQGPPPLKEGDDLRIAS